MIQAAGILFYTPQKRALFLKRGPNSDFPGTWSFCGGHIEEGESAEEAALREAEEELGDFPKGILKLWTRSKAIPAPALPLGAPEAATSEAPAPAPLIAPQEGVDFTAFAQLCKEEFTPTLNEEHTGYAWAPMDDPPQPLHPNAQIALDRFNMDERQVAIAIAEGRLTSPQFYENMWLFAIRITGTGLAFRSKGKEFVWRDPDLYMNQAFLDRCNGLACIFEHPPKATLDSKEFKERIVGAVCYPYMKPEGETGPEVWGIAKIYDDETVDLMRKDQVSTSPAVLFRDPTVNSKVRLESGAPLLIEGKPSLLDHIAICEQGVWDKGGAPRGVLSAEIEEVEAMADAKERTADEEAARKDAENTGTMLDKVLKGIDAIMDSQEKDRARLDAVCAKMDSMEKEKADSEKKADEPSEREEMAEKMKEKKADKKKDSAKKDEKEEEDDDEDGEEKGKAKEVVADKKKDSAKKDEEEEEKKDDDDEEEEKHEKKADAVSLKDELAELRRMMPKQLTDADYALFSKIQERADTVASAFGDSAPRPLQGETPLAYRRRLATKFKQHSQGWKDTDLSKIADDNAFGVIEDQIYADAEKAALSPASVADDDLRMIERRMPSGHMERRFAGRPSAWMSQFSGSKNFVKKVNNLKERA